MENINQIERKILTIKCNKCTVVALFFVFLLSSATISFAEEPQPKQENIMSNTAFQLKQIQKMAAYNTWANQQFTSWLSVADSSQWNKHVESSFNSLELTLRHLWNAENGWLTTLKKQPWKAAIEKDQIMTQEEMLAGFIKTSIEFHQFVETMSNSDLNESRNIGKDQKAVSVADIIQHVFNHATYHRGQLITMGRQVGLSSPPRTDYIYFITQ
jgi:uncharacterized damage-inducible protein DinB